MICVIFAHPYPSRSRANRALLDAIRTLPGVETRSLYDLYPDFDIEVKDEQAALERARLIVWMHPTYWYSVPGLLKHWFDKVLAHGWAYGDGGDALRGKHCLWVTTTGGDENAYTAEGAHEHLHENFIAPIEQTARYCGMQWEVPFVLHAPNHLSDTILEERAQRLRQRIEQWRMQMPQPAAEQVSL